jgi:tripartite-type tricarboxylate transporter receptor subunit TctC
VLDKQAIPVEISTPEALRAQIAADIEKWREVARVAGVKPE